MPFRPPGRFSLAMAVGITLTTVAGEVFLSTCSVPPTTPSPPPPQLVTVTVTAAGFTPVAIATARARLEIVNGDNVPHSIWSDPHPGHSTCAELNLGPVPPGQRVSILTILETGRTCGFHDDTRLGDPAFEGRISVQ